MNFLTTVLLFWLAQAFAFNAVHPVSSASQQTSDDKLSTNDYETYLSLNCRLTSESTIEAGMYPQMQLRIKNTSKNRTFRIVKTGDGSDVGWRPPHVFPLVEYKNAKGVWEEAPQVPAMGRCGNYDSNWQKDYVDLAPKKEIRVDQWIYGIGQYEFQKRGRYRVTWRYRFRHDQTKGGAKGDVRTRSKNSDVKDIPNFQLKSNPIMLEVRRPLELKLNLKSDKISNSTQLQDAFSVTIFNRSKDPLQICSPTVHGDARLYFEVVPRDSTLSGFARVVLPTADNQKPIQATLKPNQGAELMGQNSLANGIGGRWTSARFGQLKVRAIYKRSTWKSSPSLASDWVDVFVQEK